MPRSPADVELYAAPWVTGMRMANRLTEPMVVKAPYEGPGTFDKQLQELFARMQLLVFLQGMTHVIGVETSVQLNEPAYVSICGLGCELVPIE